MPTSKICASVISAFGRASAYIEESSDVADVVHELMKNRNKTENTFSMYILSTFLIAALSLLGNTNCLANETCSNFDTIDKDQNYYILSDNYPYNYTPGSSCSWRIVSDDGPIKVTCNIFDLPESNFCDEDVFFIDDSPERHRYCGNGKINFVSTSNEVTISHASSRTSPGGRFLCILSTSRPEFEPTDCRCGWTDN